MRDLDRYGLSLVTGPAGEPVNLDQAKKQCEIATAIDAHDEMLTNFIVGAREAVEALTHRQLLTATWKLFLDAFPRSSPIRLPLGRLQSVTWVKYFDADGVEQTLSSADYKVITATEPGEISLRSGRTWPTTLGEAHAVSIQFVCGFGAATAVPMAVRQAILLTVAEWFEQRSQGEIPRGALALLEQNRHGDVFTNYAG